MKKVKRKNGGVRVSPSLIRGTAVTDDGLVVEVTDGVSDRYRGSLFYDLAKTSVIRLAWAQAQELAPHGGTAVALTPGWMRSELMLEHHRVSESNWRDATERTPHFCISESPRFVGRAVAALAGDPELSRWNGGSLSSGQLAGVYGFTDLALARTRLDKAVAAAPTDTAPRMRYAEILFTAGEPVAAIGDAKGLQAGVDRPEPGGHARRRARAADARDSPMHTIPCTPA